MMITSKIMPYMVIKISIKIMRFMRKRPLELLQIRANHEENLAEEKSCKDIAEAGHHQKSIRKVQIILPIK